MATNIGIKALEDDLLAAVREVPAFADNSFSVFSKEALESRVGAGSTAALTLPLCGVTYDGKFPNDKGSPVSSDRVSSSVTMVDAQFTVILAVQYQYAGQEDTRSAAYALLDQLRTHIHGRLSATKRPWRFVVEVPNDEASDDGLVFYSQVWRTLTPLVQVST